MPTPMPPASTCAWARDGSGRSPAAPSSTGSCLASNSSQTPGEADLRHRGQRRETDSVIATLAAPPACSTRVNSGRPSRDQIAGLAVTAACFLLVGVGLMHAGVLDGSA